MKEFNLSEKIIWNSQHNRPELLEVEDIKEFIKRLKEKYCKCKLLKSKCGFCLFINKLIGDKLK